MRLLIECKNAVCLLTAKERVVCPSTEDTIFAYQPTASVIATHRLGVVTDTDLSPAFVHRCLLSPSSLLPNVDTLVDSHSTTQLFVTARVHASTPFISCLRLVCVMACCMVYSNFSSLT